MHGWAIAATLMLAFAVPILALLAAMSLAAVDSPTVAQRRALHVALVCQNQRDRALRQQPDCAREFSRLPHP